MPYSLVRNGTAKARRIPSGSSLCSILSDGLDILHIISKLPVQMGEHIGRQILCRHAGFQTGKAADLFRRNRAYTGEACVDSLAKRHGLRSQRLNEGIRAYIQGILLRHGIRYKISPPRKHLPDGAHLCVDMLDTVYDHILVITENDIAVFPHDLDDQLLLTEVSKFI